MLIHYEGGLHMTKYREILRLTALGLSLRDIEKSLKVSRKTVVKVQKRAHELYFSFEPRYIRQSVSGSGWQESQKMGEDIH